MEDKDLRETIHVPVPESQSSGGLRMGSGTRIRKAPSPEEQMVKDLNIITPMYRGGLPEDHEPDLVDIIIGRVEDCDPPGACATHGQCWRHTDWDGD